MATITKRSWGEGKEAWVVRYQDNSGTQRLKTFPTKKAAQAWLVDAQVEIRDGRHTAASTSITVEQAGESWVRQAELDGIERGTVRCYREHLKLHIAPFIGAVKLSALTAASINEFRNRLQVEGRSRVMLSKVIVSLGAIVDSAMANGKVTQNVVRIPAPRNRRAQTLAARHSKRVEVGVDLPTKEELRAILAAATGWIKPVVWTATFTGMRVSEIRGLRWQDISADWKELHVRQRADRTYDTIGTVKTKAARRTIPLAPVLVAVLKEWKLACPKGPLDLVFPNRCGEVRRYEDIVKRGLVDAEIAAGIMPIHVPYDGRKTTTPKYAMHAFRHAAASLFIEQNWTPKKIQTILGHSTIGMTFDVYGHMFPSQEDDQQAMAALSAGLLG
jgi:integrase